MSVFYYHPPPRREESILWFEISILPKMLMISNKDVGVYIMNIVQILEYFNLYAIYIHIISTPPHHLTLLTFKCLLTASLQ